MNHKYVIINSREETVKSASDSKYIIFSKIKFHVSQTNIKTIAKNESHIF